MKNQGGNEIWISCWNSGVVDQQPTRRTHISSECQAMKILWDQAVKFHSTAQKKMPQCRHMGGTFSILGQRDQPI